MRDYSFITYAKVTSNYEVADLGEEMLLFPNNDQQDPKQNKEVKLNGILRDIYTAIKSDMPFSSIVRLLSTKYILDAFMLIQEFNEHIDMLIEAQAIEIIDDVDTNSLEEFLDVLTNMDAN